MRIAILACFLFTAGNVHAGDAWTSLDGRWTGRGEVRGMPAQIELEFRPALGGRGRHLRFDNRMTTPDGTPWVFRAEALYLCADDGTCRGHWYDNRGTVLPLSAQRLDDRLVVTWGDAGTERGRTTYRLGDDGRLAITDEVQARDGTLRVFGETSAGPVKGTSPR